MCCQRLSCRATGALVALILVLSGCGDSKPRPPAPNAPGPVVFQGGEVLAESAEEVVSEDFKVGDKIKAVVDVFAGPITVTAGADHVVKAKVTKKAFGKTKEEAVEKLKALSVTVSMAMGMVRVAAERPKDANLSAS